jgi:DNA-binding response OmpR family regulator
MAGAAPILVVDDDDAYRGLLCHYLRDFGHQVLEAGDGESAYGIVSAQCVELMILDIVMPEVEGLETIGRFRRDGYGVPIVAVSGVTRASDYLTVALRLGANATVEKTAPIAELLATVRSILDDAGVPEFTPDAIASRDRSDK